MRIFSLLLVVSLVACNGSNSNPSTGSGGVKALMNPAANLTDPAAFYDFPYPSDLRLDAEGRPVLDGFPNPKAVAVVDDLLLIAKQRKAYPVLPVGYFRFSGPIAKQTADIILPADPGSPVLLIDIDPDSETRGALVPTVAASLEEDHYVASRLLAVAARPGFVLKGNHTYAFVVRRSLGDDEGKPLGVPAFLQAVRAGKNPGGALGADAVAQYAPLWETLELVGVPAAEVAAATVFTTADVVEELSAMSEQLLAKHTVQITNLTFSEAHPRYCEFVGEVSYPQFQQGEPPFNKTVAEAGLFSFDSGGLPKKLRDEKAPVTITIPHGAMPAGGFPLTLYFHGSGGVHGQVVDRGPVLVEGGDTTPGEGPAHVLAPHGFASAGSALPVNPDRLEGADDIAYLNLDNVSAFRDTFRQGAIEQRMFLSALLDLKIDPATVGAACTEATVPAGDKFRFDPEKVAAMGQSMGGMYTNVIGAIDPRFKAAVPTGAGGYWGYFILETSLIPGAKALLGILLQTQAELSFLHPAMALLETAWEPAEPLVYMPRLAHRPLPGHPVRPVYEPVGKDDSYFPTVLYDAVAIAYGHEQAGEEVWPTMQEALALAGFDGLIDYPVKNNLESLDGTPFTGVVVQYEGDGIYDPHAIYGQLDEVKYQYGCFLETFFATGTAVVPAPAALGTPCPK
jgi:dienelactone hydrolase